MYVWNVFNNNKNVFFVFFLKNCFFQTLWDGTYREFKLKWGWRTWVLKRHIFELDVQSQMNESIIDISQYYKCISPSYYLTESTVITFMTSSADRTHIRWEKER